MSCARGWLADVVATMVTTQADIVYATVDGIQLALDLYLPEGEGPHPAVVYLHGGAWQEGDKSADGETRLAALAAHGIAVLSANYRLLNQALFPAQIHDVKGVIRWVRAHGAEHGLATERVGVWGASAGALLGSLAALTPGDAEFEGSTGGNLDASSAVDAVVHWFGPVDLVSGEHRSWLEKILLAPPLEPPLFGVESLDGVQDRARAASPLHRVSAAAPPFLVSHGDRDRVLPESEGASFHDALVRAGATSSYVVVGGAGHEDHAFDSAANLAMTAAFLLSSLRP